MSPSRSKTIVLPSGLTSTFIHVPSLVSNSTSRVGPCFAVTSHRAGITGAALCCGSCAASGAARVMAMANVRRDTMRASFLWCGRWTSLYGRSDAPGMRVRCYLPTMGARELITELERTRDETLRYFALDDDALARTYGPGKWPVRFILLHLADAETVLFDRIRRVLSEPRQ